MTIDEAINELIQCYNLNSKTAKKQNEAINMAIEALGKQIPMKLLPPEMGIDGRVITPCGYCGEELPKKAFYTYCPYCGQKIKR